MRSALLVGVFAVLLPLSGTVSGTGYAATASSSAHQTNQALLIARRMQRAVQRAPRLEAVGGLRAQNVPPEHLLYRYLAPGRESIVRSGGGLAHIQIGNRPLSTVQEISIGKTLYRTVDGTHWLHTARPTAPSPLDVFTLNDSNAMCCDATTSATGTSVTLAGSRPGPGGKAYTLVFRAAAAGQLIVTRVMVSAKSYLPQSYTSTTQPTSTVSQLTFRYHSAFSIRQPR